MLKITIDNEEVLSNKNFTIEEEMLNTPSVVLDNVYPKSWENDKDYVNRFYHPNDYSKCLIKDENYTPAEPGLNVEGTSFQINADITKRYEITSMKGQTTQSSTPTPTAPQPINVVSGRQDIVVAGKNLFDKDSGITQGKTYSNTGATSNLTNAFVQNDYIPVESSTTYTMSTTNNYSSTTDYRLVICEYKSDKTFIKRNLGGSAVGNKYTITTNAETKYVRLCASTITIDELQLEKGSQATTYEAYKGNTYEINLGKNLLKAKEGTYTYSTSHTYVVNDDNIKVSVNNASYQGGAINLSTGLTSQWAGGRANDNHLTNNGGSYTLSCEASGDINAGSSTGFLSLYYYVYNQDGTSTSSQVKLTPNDITKKAITLNSNQHIGCIVIYSQYITCENVELKIQVERGEATSYAPYKTPIELCKIGNYQDRIYKNGNKWYLEKNIGKTVITNDNKNIITAYGTNANHKKIDINKTALGWQSNNTTGIALINKYKEVSSFANVDTGCFGCNFNASVVRIWNDDFTDLTNAQNTLIGTEIYIAQATPTTTEITDTELISQLESIELLEGLNNVSVVSPYLQGIINLHYNFQDDETTSNLLFCGVVKNSGNISLNPRYPHYQSLQILDFKTFLSEGETLDFVIANKTIEEAIDQIISTISPYGFVKGNIQIIGAGTIIGAYSTKDKTAYDVFNYLADITQSRWTTRMVDENTVAIDFYDPTLLPQGTPINYTATWFRDNLIDDMSYSYGSNDYRNKQVMTSNEVVGDLEQAQVLYANGFQTQFMTELKIAQLTEISVNGVPKTFATNDDKELGIEADFYYSIGNNIVESADTYSTGDEIVIRYLPIVEGRQIITNNDEIDRVSTATGRKGIVARYENRNDATTSTELQLIGQSYIKYKGTPEIKLTIVSRKNLWNIGDRVQFNAPIDELKTEYMVKKKTINRILANPSSEEHIVYTFEMTSSFNSEQAINYFDNQRAKAKGNIGQGDAISRNIDIEETTEIIFYGSSIVEVSTTGDNVLNSTLNSPLNN